MRTKFARQLDAQLDAVLPKIKGADAPLARACRIAALAGGKRLRPLLLSEAYQACGGKEGAPLLAGAALEAVHIYSLIHDDLPCMDDGLMRHGQPALHRQVGEGMALLAGNMLFAHAFRWLAKTETHPNAACRLRLASLLAGASEAMMEGQARDLNAPQDVEAILALHRLKTGALMGAACAMGACLAGADEKQVEALTLFGREIGLAFQIRDDLVAQPDKSSARDDAPNLLRVLGMEQAQALCHESHQCALAQLKPFGAAGNNLAQLADDMLADVSASPPLKVSA